MKLRFKLFIFTLLSVMVLMSTTSVAALPPLNAEIGNQATLEYYNAVGVHRTIVSNVVITKVNAFYGFTVDGGNMGTSVTLQAEAGTTTYFTHEIINTSNTEATFSFATTSIATGLTTEIYINGVDYTSQTLTLAAGASQIVTVNVTSESTLAVNTDYEYTLDVTCNEMTAIERTISVTDVVHTVSTVAIIYITNETDITSGSIDEEIEVTYHVVNKGSVHSGEFELVMDVKEFYSFVETRSVTYSYYTSGVKITNTILLSIGENTQDGLIFNYDGEKITVTCTTVEFVDAISDSLEISYYIKCNQVYSNNYYVHYEYKYQETTATSEYITIVNTTACSYTVNTRLAVKIEGEDKRAEQGSLVIFANKVTNLGNKDDSFDIHLLEDAFPGGTEFYLAYGPHQDQITGEYTPSDLEKVPLIDTDGSGTVDTGIIEPGKYRYVLLFAQLPLEGVGSGYKVKNEAISGVSIKNGGSKADGTLAFYQAYDTLTIDASSVDITSKYSVNDTLAGTVEIGRGKGPEASPVDTKYKGSGDTAYFLLYINNTNEFLTEEYIIDYSFDSEFKSTIVKEGITVEIQSVEGAYISSTGPIAPGNYRPVRAIVRSTNLTLAQSFNIFFRVRSKTTEATDIINEMIVIEEDRDLAIIPDAQAETYPNTKVIYSHIVVNRGNVIEGDDINSKVLLFTEESTVDEDGNAVLDENIFTSTLFWDKNNNGVLEESIDPHIEDLSMEGIEGLYPGESIRIFCEVHIGIKAEPGMVDTTYVKLDISSNSYIIKEMEMLAVDTTTIKQDNLTIVKMQGILDNEDDIVPPYYTEGELQGDPGDIICYQITVINTGEDGVNNVSIEDVVPQYTKLYEKATIQYMNNEPSLSGITQPPVGYRGSIYGTVPWLGAGETAVLRFKVKIDE